MLVLTRRRLQRDALDGPGAGDRHRGHRARRASRCCPRSSPRSAAARSRKHAQAVDALAADRRARPRPSRSRSPSACSLILIAGALGNLKRPRHARLQRAVPQPAGVGPGPAAACRRSSRPARPARSTSLDRRQEGRRRAARSSASTSSYSADLVGFSRDGKLALVRVDAQPGPVHRARDRGDPADPRATRARSTPSALVGGPTAEVLDSADRAQRATPS